MADQKKAKRGLGRGLSALMADVQHAHHPVQASGAAGLQNVPIEKLLPCPDQPRRRFDEADLKDLAASIREKGVLQPLIARPHPTHEGEYEIVAGERRWRAAQLARLHELPVVVRSYDDGEVLEIAIIENVQRQDLNPVEEARGYRQLMERFGHTQEQLAAALSKSRSHIANVMRLLQLPDDVLEMLEEGKLSAGHARALITSGNASALAKEIVGKGMSVREAERLARKGAASNGKAKARKGTEKDADTRALEADLSANLKMKVSIDHREDGSGVMTIRYRSMDELDELCRILSATS